MEKATFTTGYGSLQRRNQRENENQQPLLDRLYQQIGQLQVELDWLKKNQVWSNSQKRLLTDPAHSSISIARQCALLGLHRSGYYYEPCGESEENLQLMRLLDQQYMDTPYYGIGRMQWFLGQKGYQVNHKRVARLLRIMGLEAVYPKPNLSKANPAHKIYPYLLRGVKIEQVNQVLSTDITYIPMAKGFMYLVAVMDGPAHPEHRRAGTLDLY
jgi:putative transposase